MLPRRRKPVAPDASHRRLLAAVVAASPDAGAILLRVAQFDTLRLRPLKIATRVVEWKTRVMLHLLSACPDQAILRLALERMPRLVI